MLLVFLPCYIGHLMLCLLSGPVLHISQHMRASLSNANMGVTLVLQLCAGYVHLWGVGFIEGCFMDICSPTLIRRASSDFVFGVLLSHRRLYGSSLASGG